MKAVPNRAPATHAILKFSNGYCVELTDPEIGLWPRRKTYDDEVAFSVEKSAAWTTERNPFKDFPDGTFLEQAELTLPGGVRYLVDFPVGVKGVIDFDTVTGVTPSLWFTARMRDVHITYPTGFGKETLPRVKVEEPDWVADLYVTNRETGERCLLGQFLTFDTYKHPHFKEKHFVLKRGMYVADTLKKVFGTDKQDAWKSCPLFEIASLITSEVFKDVAVEEVVYCGDKHYIAGNYIAVASVGGYFKYTMK